MHDIISFEVDKFEDTDVGQLEFFTVLKKPLQIPDEDVKHKCLSTIPTIKLENILSPYMPQVKALSDAMQSSTKIIESLQKEASELRAEVKRNENEIQGLQISVDFMQSILDRRSVKLVLSLVDNFCAILRRKVKKKLLNRELLFLTFNMIFEHSDV